MHPIWAEALGYNRWATLQLLDACSPLTDEQLQLTSPGTYGTIAATLQHMLSAEQRYVKRLGGTEQRLTEKAAFPGVVELKEHAARSGDELVEVASRLSDRDTTMVKYHDGTDIPLSVWTIVTQAIHHGNDHRTQVCTILGQEGIEVDIDVWGYGLMKHRGEVR